jgi:hypothetical protein
MMALQGTLLAPPFLMLDDHAEAFSPKAVLALVRNASIGAACHANKGTRIGA